MKMKNKRWLLWGFIMQMLLLPFPLVAQYANEFQLMLPEGMKYMTLNIDETGFTPCFTSNSKGEIYYSTKNLIVGVGINQQIELPANYTPTTICWTNNEKLVMFANDTLFLMDAGHLFHPILSISTHIPIIHAIGTGDFAFCAKNDTVLYRYSPETDSLSDIITLDLPIHDFIVDNEDYYIAYGNRLMVLTKEHVLLPLLIDSEPITNIAFCGNSSFFISTASGLWFVNDKREKELIISVPIITMVTDDYDRGFFMFPDGTWLYMSPISIYETEQENTTLK